MQERDINRPNVAVASFNGIEVNMHIGHARQLLIFGPSEDGQICMLGKRSTPEPGSGDERWRKLAKGLNDCFAILASGAGPKPLKALEDSGVSVLITEGNVKWCVDTVFRGSITRDSNPLGNCCRH